MNRDSPPVTRRGLAAKIREWSAASIVGGIAVQIFEEATKRAGVGLDQIANDVVEKMIGSTVELAVWTGDALVGIEFDFEQTSTGYRLTGRRVVRIYKEGARCAQAGQSMIETGLLIMKLADLHIEVDLEEVSGLG